MDIARGFECVIDNPVVLKTPTFICQKIATRLILLGIQDYWYVKILMHGTYISHECLIGDWSEHIYRECQRNPTNRVEVHIKNQFDDVNKLFSLENSKKEKNLSSFNIWCTTGIIFKIGKFKSKSATQSKRNNNWIYFFFSMDIVWMGPIVKPKSIDERTQ